MRSKIILLVCILTVTFASLYASVNKGFHKPVIHVSVCVAGTVRCLPIDEADKLVKQGLGVYGDCSTANTGKIIRCKPKR